MFRKIILTVLIVLLSGALLGSWFHFAGRLENSGRRQERCGKVNIILPDSLESAIVDRAEVYRYVSAIVDGRPTDSIDLDTIEKTLRARGEVMSAQVYVSSPGEISIKLTQRKPVVRFDNGSFRCYCDPEGYLFPVTNAVDVPLVTGNIPLNLSEEYRGEAPAAVRSWVLGMVALAGHIDSREVLRREIEQIDVSDNGDIVLYTAEDGPGIIFGDSGGLHDKFRKLDAWWRTILPEARAEGKQYKTINLKYNNQIICK